MSKMSKIKKSLLILVSASLVLTGCGDKEKTVDTDIDLSSYPIQTEETLTYWKSLPTNISTSVDNYGATDIAKEFEKRTGVKVKYIHPAAGQEREALNLMISSNDLPDIIENNWGIYPGGPTKVLADGVGIDLAQYKEYAPAFFKTLSDNPEWDRASKTDNGEYYAFVSIYSSDNLLLASGPAVRMDWLRELGLSEPKSIDDWTEMLTAFKEKKGAIAPLSFNYPNICYFFNMFEASFDPYVENGEVKYGAVQPEFKRALTVIRDWFDKGLLDKNIVSVDSKLIDNQIYNDKTGALITSGGGGIGQYMKMAKQPGFDLQGVAYPTFSGEPSKTIPVSAPAGGYGAAVTSQSKNPALAVKFLDYCYTEDGHKLSNFGVEGVAHEMKDGYPTYTDLIMNNPDGLTVSQALGLYVKAGNGGAFVLDSKYIEQYYELPQQKKALEAWTSNIEDSKKRAEPAITCTVEESSEYSRIMNEVDKYRNQMIVKFINGIEPIENFDKYVSTMKQLGVDRAMEIKTQALARYNSR